MAHNEPVSTYRSLNKNIKVFQSLPTQVLCYYQDYLVKAWIQIIFINMFLFQQK